MRLRRSLISHPSILLLASATRDAAVLIQARAIRAFGDGFVSVLLPVYLAALGYGALGVGAVVTAALVGSAAVTLAVGLLAHRYPAGRCSSGPRS